MPLSSAAIVYAKANGIAQPEQTDNIQKLPQLRQNLAQAQQQLTSAISASPAYTAYDKLSNYDPNRTSLTRNEITQIQVELIRFADARGITANSPQPQRSIWDAGHADAGRFTVGALSGLARDLLGSSSSYRNQSAQINSLEAQIDNQKQQIDNLVKLEGIIEKRVADHKQEVQQQAKQAQQQATAQAAQEAREAAQRAQQEVEQRAQAEKQRAQEAKETRVLEEKSAEAYANSPIDPKLTEVAIAGRVEGLSSEAVARLANSLNHEAGLTRKEFSRLMDNLNAGMATASPEFKEAISHSTSHATLIAKMKEGPLTVATMNDIVAKEQRLFGLISATVDAIVGPQSANMRADSPLVFKNIYAEIVTHHADKNILLGDMVALNEMAKQVAALQHDYVVTNNGKNPEKIKAYEALERAVCNQLVKYDPKQGIDNVYKNVQQEIEKAHVKFEGLRGDKVAKAFGQISDEAYRGIDKLKTKFDDKFVANVQSKVNKDQAVPSPKGEQPTKPQATVSAAVVKSAARSLPTAEELAKAQNNSAAASATANPKPKSQMNQRNRDAPSLK